MKVSQQKKNKILYLILELDLIGVLMYLFAFSYLIVAFDFALSRKADHLFLSAVLHLI